MGGTEQMSVSIDWRTRTIKGNAFYGFAINSVTFPSNSTLLVIEESAFGGTPLTSISFPSNVEEIGVKAFSKCSNLKQAILSDSVRYINESAFESSGLEFISIPKQMISIGPKAFMDCKSLGMLSFDSPHSCSIESIGDQCFANTKILSARIPFSCNSLGIKTFEGSLLKSVVFESPLGEPSQMKGVSDKAFIGCESLTEITFGTSISSVGVSSFEGCVSLQSLVLSDRITSIGIMAFKGCYRLETVSIPDKSKLADIGHQSFSGCESLRTFVVGSGTSFQFTAGCLFNREITKIVIYPYGSIQKKFKVPLTVQEISGYSFEGAVSLEEIYLKDCRISRIGFRAFGRCQKLKLVELPSTLSAVDGEAFAECTSLSCGSFQFAEEADIKSQRSMLSKTGLSDYVLHPCATRIFTADENPTAIAVLAFSSAAELTDDAS